MNKPDINRYYDDNGNMHWVEYANDLNEYVYYLEKEFRSLKNEHCYKCGRYSNAHLGSCDNCKWKEIGETHETK